MNKDEKTIHDSMIETLPRLIEEAKQNLREAQKRYNRLIKTLEKEKKWKEQSK